MCGVVVMALTFTGQPGPMRIVQSVANGVSPGNTGNPGPMAGEMSQSFMAPAR